MTSATELRTRGSKVYMTDGSYVRKIHIAFDSVAGNAHVFMLAPWKRVNQYAASTEGAMRNLVERMKREGWRVA